MTATTNVFELDLLPEYVTVIDYQPKMLLIDYFVQIANTMALLSGFPINFVLHVLHGWLKTSKSLIGHWINWHRRDRVHPQ